jgi:hypothetical protein
MLTGPPAARKRLLRRPGRENVAADIAMRFTRTEDGRRLRPDRAGPDDTAFSCEGRNVPLLDAAVAQARTGRTLDVRSAANGERLKRRRIQGGSE